MRTIGGIGIAASVYFLIGGIITLGSGGLAKDSRDYFKTWVRTMKQDSHAVVFEPDGKWIVSDMKNVIIDVESETPVFIGIATATSVDSYLGGVARDEVISLPMFPPITTWQHVSGGQPSGNPGAQDFWSLTATGTGMNSLEWNLKEDLSFVIMNADGSAGIDVVTRIYTEYAFTSFLGLSNMGIGVFLLLLSLIIVLSTRKYKSTVYPMPLNLPSKK
jgi:hypothetical protein